MTKNPFLTVALGDFNAKSQTSFKNDKKSFEGSKLDILTCSHGLHQLINEPTDLLGSSSWYYNRANADPIRRAIDLFDCDKALRINGVDKQVAIFRDTLINSN